MARTNGLIQYMKTLEKDMEVTIIIKDFIGFLNGDNEVFRGLQEFYIHGSSYCMLVKEQKALWDECLHGSDLMKEKLVRTKKAYLGYCHAGVGEYVVPIIGNSGSREIVFGAVTIGGFTHPQWEGKRDRLQEQYGISIKEMKKSYKSSVKENEYSIGQIEDKVAIIAEYIGMLCNSLDLEMPDSIKAQFDHNYIIGHATAYIKRHYKEEISLNDLANFCHCSQSYISHNFRRLLGVNIKQYINSLRIEAGKSLLSQTDIPVTEIAYKMGYKDSNYFTKVFSDLCGLSPNKYRKASREQEY